MLKDWFRKKSVEKYNFVKFYVVDGQINIDYSVLDVDEFTDLIQYLAETGLSDLLETLIDDLEEKGQEELLNTILRNIVRDMPDNVLITPAEYEG